VTDQKYATPEAFKQAVETRLRAEALASGVPMNRLRQTMVFDRFLARVFAEMGDRAVAKGGVVLELRLARARTTRDVDLGFSGDLDGVLSALTRSGALDLGDRLTFQVARDREHPTIDVEGMIYGGRRFRAECRLAGKPYGMPFGVDVAAGDALAVAPEFIEGTRFLAFAGIKPARLRVYPREVHVAEKLHAYTLPRARPNSRVKDLPDLALLAQTGPFDVVRLRAALERTFTFRSTHELPAHLPDPPSQWAAIYTRMAATDDLPWRTMDELLVTVRSFLDPVLAGKAVRWDPSSGGWMP
jgi:predicted nucleotidyltransferase component of viral defense system